MASPTLPASPTPQEVNASILLTAWRIGEQLPPRFGSCDFEDEHSNCKQKAVVHQLGTDHEYCLAHFQEVERV